MYSGDITSAPDGASEWMYTGNGIDQDYLITVNAYRAPTEPTDQPLRFKFIVGLVDEPNNDGYGYKFHNYIIKPQEVVFQTDVVLTQNQMNLGLVKKDPVTDSISIQFIGRGASEDRVSSFDSSVMEISRKAFLQQMDSLVFFDEIFPHGTKEDSKFDLSDPTLLTEDLIFNQLLC